MSRMASTSESVSSSAPLSINSPAAPRKIGFLSAEAWKPMKYPIFAGLWIATLLNYTGTAARDNMGSQWLMSNVLAQGPRLVGLVTVAATLPLALFSVFAGTLADLFDRRRLLIATQIWMIAISVLLCICTWTGWISPWGLLGLTVLLALGTAASNPAFQAVLPELVPPKDISLAMGLNSVALNLARAGAPVLFMIAMLIWKGKNGISASYLLVALTFVGVTAVLLAWKRPPERAAVHGERFWGALKSGLQYTVHSWANVAILLRVFTFIVPALVLLSQLPILAKQLHVGPVGFALLMAFFGTGAILGVFMMQDLQRRFSLDGAVNGCTAMFAACLILLSWICQSSISRTSGQLAYVEAHPLQNHHAWLADLVMFALGINWVIVPTNFNVATQTSVPGWVKGRALSMYLTVLWGSFAIGAAIWGPVVEAHGFPTALLSGGIVMAGLLVMLAKTFPLTLTAGQDLSPALKGGATLPADLPMVLNHSGELAGPVHVRISYDVQTAATAEFLHLAREVGKHRRRNGAASWRIEELSQSDGRTTGAFYTEHFSFATAGECTRQPARLTAADVDLLQRFRRMHSGAEAPVIACHSTGTPAGVTGGRWWKAQVYRAIDRTLEEIENAIRRAIKGHEGP
jgi:MFS family permease